MAHVINSRKLNQLETLENRKTEDSYSKIFTSHK